MPLSTTMFQNLAVQAMLDSQAKLSKTQLQVSTGRRILSPADDPSASAQILELSQGKSMAGQYQENGNVATARLQLEEGILANVTNVLQRINELTVQANNATQSNEARRGIASELQERVEELLGLANTQDANGEHIFAGFKGDTVPFTRNASGGFQYSGDSGQRFLQVGPARQIAIGDSGLDTFVSIRNGNGIFRTDANNANTGDAVIDAGFVSGTYVPPAAGAVPPRYEIRVTQALPTNPITYEVVDVGSGASVVAAGTAYVSGSTINITGTGINVALTGTPANGDVFEITTSTDQDIFTTVQNLVNTLNTQVDNPADRGQLNTDVGRALSEVSLAIGNILDIRASIGGRLNAVDTQQAVSADVELQVEERLSQLRDLDFAEAISRLNLEVTALQAAQQSFVKIQGLSLFNFL